MLSFLLLVLVVRGLEADPLLVQTPLGQIRGLAADDGNYAMFLGIPFARVDHENPFGASEPYPDFTEVFQANNDSAICPQREELSNEFRGTIDCLNVNVYVPNAPAPGPTNQRRLPVLAWIHGGGFQNGYGGKVLYGPKYLVRHDIIVVTINYRLGPYGFMCLDVPEVSGNQGFKDQTLALRWIRENIGAFGGDPSKVTIYGESAGAASAEFHMASENEVLFQQAILSSGAIYGGWTIGQIDNNGPINLAARLGLQTDNVRDALAHLKTVDPIRVVQESSFVPNRFTGCVERRFSSVEGFLHTHPFTMTTLPKAENISIITGYNDQEMLMSFINTPEDAFPNLDPFMNFARGYPEDQMDSVYNSVRRFYIGDVNITADLRWNLIDFNSDQMFNHPSHRSLDRFLLTGSKTYHYIFSYTGGRNMVKVRMNVTEGGAAHADELGYVFDMQPLSGLGSAADLVTVDRVTMLWANFVKFGNPTPAVTPLLPVIWPEATKDQLHYLDIGTNLVPSLRPFHDRMTFWDVFVRAFPSEIPQDNGAFSNRFSQPTALQKRATAAISASKLYICTIWHNAHLKNPTTYQPDNNGWVLKDDKCQFKWFEGDQLPSHVSGSLKTQSETDEEGDVEDDHAIDWSSSDEENENIDDNA
ncbi:unnamed protein product [Leptosia nina]|uniref:Carboxylic ester hydrolase n=1 Tax=Leptosia nina TaxID=320188 RepID=A0AAV1K1N8_9NEOP